MNRKRFLIASLAALALGFGINSADAQGANISPSPMLGEGRGEVEQSQTNQTSTAYGTFSYSLGEGKIKGFAAEEKLHPELVSGSPYSASDVMFRHSEALAEESPYNANIAYVQSGDPSLSLRMTSNHVITSEQSECSNPLNNEIATVVSLPRNDMRGTVTGFAAPTPTLDEMQSNASDVLPTLGKYTLTGLTGTEKAPTGTQEIGFNGKRYYFTPAETTTEKANMLSYLAGSMAVAYTTTGASSTNYLFKAGSTYYTIDTTKLPTSGYAWDTAGRLVNLTDGTSSNYDFSVIQSDSEGSTTTNYYNITIDPNKADHNKGKTTWSAQLTSAPSGYSWYTTRVAGSNVTVDTDAGTVTGATSLKTPHNGTTPAAGSWNKWFTYTYTKPANYEFIADNTFTVSTYAAGKNSAYKVATNGRSTNVITNYTYAAITTEDASITNKTYANNVLTATFRHNFNIIGGSAILNLGTIGDVVADFVGNRTTTSTNSYNNFVMGAIANVSVTSGITASINSITGDFVGNFSDYSSYYSYGGAISNYAQNGTASIGSIVGDFVGNSSYSYSSYSYGGAISNYAYSSGAASIGSITGDFTGNYAKTTSSSGKAYGGAIFNGYVSSGTPKYNANAQITLAGNTFTGNYVDNNGTITPNGIYNAGVINIKDGATVTINDGWQSFDDGTNAGQLVMGTGSTLNMNIGNGTIQQDSLGAITNVGTINATVDLDLTDIASPTSDTITVSSVTQEGFINLTGLNLIGDLDTYKDHEFTKRVLINSNGSSDLQLKIAMAASGDKYVLQQGETAHSDTFDGNAKWTDTYESYNLSTDIVGDIATTDTTTTNDSITFTVTGTQETKSDIVQNDTLRIVNQSDLATRNFNATSEGELYTATDHLGKAGEGTININGMPTGGEAQGTIDLGGHTGFELDKATTLNLNDVVVTNASDVTGVIDGTSTDAVVNLSNSEIDGNVTNAGTVNLENSQIIGVVTNTGILNINEGAQLGSAILGSGGTTKINADYELNQVITGNDVELNNGAELSFGTTGSLSGANSFIVNSGSLNLQNGVVANTDLGNFTLNGDMDLKIDGNFASKQIDTITATSFSNPNDSSINITNVNILTPTTDEKFSISPIGTMSDDTVKASLASAIAYNAGDLAMTPIYKYHVNYDKDNAMLHFTRFGGGGGGSDSFNPSVLASPVATQAAAQVTMEQTFNYSFSNSDTFMTLPNSQRLAIRNRNKYAIAESELPEGANPLYQIQDTSNAWFKPYASFENVPLKNGPKVNVISYGALAGYDTDLKEMKRGWARAWTGFVGYNGANLNYNGVTTTQNGGILGGTLTMYKGNFFNATTLSAGATVGENSTMYGHDTTTSLLAGIGNKTGYNLEFIDGKFIVQPSLFLGYTFVKTFDYTNAAGVRIDSDPSHTMQISPGLKFIGNLKHGWQPYIGVNMVWNVLNNSHVKANSVTLPQMSVKPYIQYGIGLQKTVKDNFVAYGQAMIQNGGRNGISLTAGFRWAIGRDKKPVEKVQNNSSDKKVMKSATENKNPKIKNNKTTKKSKIQEFFAKMNGEPIVQTTITPTKAIISKI